MNRQILFVTCTMHSYLHLLTLKWISKNSLCFVHLFYQYPNSTTLIESKQPFSKFLFLILPHKEKVRSLCHALHFKFEKNFVSPKKLFSHYWCMPKKLPNCLEKLHCHFARMSFAGLNFSKDSQQRSFFNPYKWCLESSNAILLIWAWKTGKIH